MKPEIKDKDALIRIFKVISWLDYRRWSAESNYDFVNFSRNDLTNCEKILTHWICYITDRQMPFELVWDKGGYVFSELVHEYSRKGLPPQQILDEHYEKYKDKNGKDHFRFKSTDNVTFASRYPAYDYQNILQTLKVLNRQEYKRNIIAYIADIMRRFQSEEDLLKRIACGLHLLTYQLVRKEANPGEVIRIIDNDEEFNEKLEKFKRTSTTGKKRLWCCVRDYKKGLQHQIFNDAIREVAEEDAEQLINKWDSLPMNQIELPGDVWNNSPLFKDNLFANVIDLTSIPKSWEMPKIIRKLYDQLKNNGEVTDFYPEQFDVTFDFVPRMCNKKLVQLGLNPSAV